MKPRAILLLIPTLLLFSNNLLIGPSFYSFLVGNTITAGYTAGQFSVNDAGAATYSIPISASPGTAGIEPKLALTYSSQGGEGLLGTGWSLQGLSVISRSTKTLAQDGVVKGIDLSSEDTYSLDGERLVAIIGEYGSDGTEYRTEQNAFIRVISYGQRGRPESFRVWTKSGLIMEYGFSADSRIEVEGGEEILFWLVNKVEDTKGNYYTITYQENNSTGEYWPLRIDYTGNESAGLNPYNSVRFTYQNRPRLNKSYLKGHKMQSSKLVKAITSYHGNQVFRSYNLVYENNLYANSALLESVQECAGTICFEPTTFDWLTEKSFSIASAGTNLLPTADVQGTSKVLFNGDWNGDGKMDLLRWNKGSGGNKWYFRTGSMEFNTSFNNEIPTNQITNGRLAFADFNADGFTDVVWHNSSNKANNWYLNNSTSSNLNLTASGELIPTTQLENDADLYFLDWNGDGLTDIFAYKKSNGFNRFFLNSYATGGSVGFEIWNASIPASEIKNGESIFPSDWDKDGLTDLLWYDKATGANRWFINNGSGFNAPLTNLIPPNAIKDGTQFTFGDFNGDGNNDALWYDRANGQTKIYFNKGDLSFMLASHDLPATNLTGASSLLYPQDINGDGVSDIIYYRKDTGKNIWFINDGQADFSELLQTNGVAGRTNPIPQTDIDQGTALQFGAYSDSGVLDVMWYNNDSGTNRWYRNNIEQYNLLTAVTNGHGMRTEVEYSSLLEPAVYTKENTASYPTLDLQARFPVVASFSVDDGIGGRNAMRYRYKGAKINLQGRGFRGFTEIHATDETTGITESRYFDRDYRYISAPLVRSETRLSDNTLINRTDNTNQLKLFYNGQPKVHFSYTAQSVTKTYELDGSLVTTKTVKQEYDDYGNVTRSEVDFGDGHKDITTSQFLNHITNGQWLLGRLIRSEVQRIAPGQATVTKVAGFEYDAVSGLLTKEIVEPDRGTQERIVKTYKHDSYGNITESHVRAWNGTKIEDRVSYTAFDSKGRFTVNAINELGHNETRFFDQVLGVPNRVIDINGLSVTTEYDKFGRKIYEEYPDGNWMSYSYESCGNCPGNAVYLVRQESSNGPPSISYLDILDREVRSQTLGFDGTPIYVDQEYNHRGLLQRASKPYYAGETPQWTASTYDEIGREIQQNFPGNRTITMSYDGLTTLTTNPLNQTKTVNINAAGRTTWIDDNAGNRVGYGYDAQGNRTDIIDPLGNTVRTQYDHFGRKIQTNDPDLGVITYQYNQFDELLRQEDAKGAVVQLSRDSLGRMIKRVEDDFTTSWVYDLGNKGLGKLHLIITSKGYQKRFIYDDLGRVSTITETIKGINYTTSHTYDEFGRLAILTYPSGFAIKHSYNERGYLTEIRNNANNQLIWRANSYNALGQLLSQTLGNGLTTTYSYDNLRDWLSQIVTSNGVTNTVQNLSYTYNDLGHLTQRKDNRQNLTENFTYDNLNRLLEAKVVGGTTISTTYDEIGNITYKSDVGTYTYGENGAGPHAVTSIDFANGLTCVPSSVTEMDYNSFDKVQELRRGINRLTLEYGADHQRIIQKEYKGTVLQKTQTYVGGLYEIEQVDTLTRELHYIRAGGGVIAVYEKKSNNLNDIRYWHKDHLGSLQAVTDAMGVLVEEYSFDAWGNRRSPTTWAPTTETFALSYDRGFTGHEHLDTYGLINMNGRMYDPILGRFTSADPFIQDVTNLQSLNRYTYVFNNPLSLTDPSGYFSFSDLWGGIRDFVKNTFDSFTKNIRLLVDGVSDLLQGNWKNGLLNLAHFATNVAISYYTGGNSFLSSVGYGFSDAFFGTLKAGGSLNDALSSGFKNGAVAGALNYVTSSATSYLNKELTVAVADKYGHQSVFGTSEYFKKAAAHGVVQGAYTVAKGGKFEHGFAAGLAVSLASPATDNVSNKTLRLATSQLIGGTASIIGGGKFANGASSGAFIQIYNGDNVLEKGSAEYRAAMQRRDPTVSIHSWDTRSSSSSSWSFSDLVDDAKNITLFMAHEYAASSNEVAASLTFPGYIADYYAGPLINSAEMAGLRYNPKISLYLAVSPSVYQTSIKNVNFHRNKADLYYRRFKNN